jgi:putative VirB-like lipoprotein
MKRIFFMLSIIALLAACRGEPVPRDYQNAPPAMTHPPQTATQSPPARGVQPPPQPSSGVEGTAAPYQPSNPPPKPQTTTMPDKPPVTTTT